MKKITASSISSSIEKLCQSSKVSSSPKDVFTDIVQVSFNFLFNQEFMRQARPRGMNRLYLNSYYKELSHYKNDLKSWGTLQAIMMDYFKLVKESEPFTDILGEIISPFTNLSLAQHLTPWDVAKVLSSLNIQGVEKFVEKQEKFSIGDITGCGAGTLLLASLNHIDSEYGDEALRLAEIVALDKDPLMCMTTIVQIELASIFHNKQFAEFHCYLGNALTCDDTIMYRSTPNLFYTSNGSLLQIMNNEIEAVSKSCEYMKEEKSGRNKEYSNDSEFKVQKKA